MRPAGLKREWQGIRQEIKGYASSVHEQQSGGATALDYERYLASVVIARLVLEPVSEPEALRSAGACSLGVSSKDVAKLERCGYCVGVSQWIPQASSTRKTPS